MLFKQAELWMPHQGKGNKGEPPSALGLSTRKALSVLKEQLEAVLEGHLRERKKCLTWKEVWRSSFLHHSNRCSCFHWPGASLMLLAVLLLLGCCGGQPAGSRGVGLVNASALFLLLLLNLVLIGRQDRLKRREVERRLRGIIDQIQASSLPPHSDAETTHQS
ncbi:TMEM94 isoform 30 [Pan troglodytes]|uniref:Transmembrane protein 94 n=3 Tax=Homininae TaxID=207598 RepID=J3KS76_HUMAN|nr:transmembrane protein 94 [Homo sapiens]KAI4051556.1 transmembrane protein 94 [Homo sapiens]PNI32337.1 TMEM94 isoform 30 [Pan troglodytes]